jgi:hypothetical protein
VQQQQQQQQQQQSGDSSVQALRITKSRTPLLLQCAVAHCSAVYVPVRALSSCLCHALLLQVIEDFAAEQTTYLELRTTPKVGAVLATSNHMTVPSKQ